MRRRQMLQMLGAIFGASVSGGANSFAQGRRVENIGLQLFTLRREMAEDFEGTLARVAELGYREMEFAGYYGRGADEVRRALVNNGLVSPACHIPFSAIRENPAAEIEFAAEVGQRFLVVPNLPGNERGLDDYRRHAETLNSAGEACRRAGLKMGYHNHGFEFETTDDHVPYEILLEETDPELVDMELDLFWIVNAGADPFAYFSAHPGRFSMLHLKDRTADGVIADVGGGDIDFAGIFAQAASAGFQHYFVEHDNPGDGLTSIANSIGYLRELEF